MEAVSDAVAEINEAAIAPFGETLPIFPIFIVFCLLLVIAGEWRLIVDRIDKVV